MHLTNFLKMKLKSDHLGNILFWISFCVIGQPMCALLYYYAFLSKHAPQLLQDPNELSNAAADAVMHGSKGSEALSSAFMASVVT
jgi:hypothetical protein